MKILYVFADTPKEYNSARWRCEFLKDAINKIPGHEARMIFITDWLERKEEDRGGWKNTELSQWADAIVVQRNMVAGALHGMIYWKAHGKKVFVDLDDAYNLIPQSLVSSNFWMNQQHQELVEVKGEESKDPLSLKKPAKYKSTLTPLGFDPLEHLTWGLKVVDGITAPSEVICQDRRPYNKTFLIPNYPPTASYLEAAEKKQPHEDGEIWIGWGGGGSHLESFTESGVLPALARVAEKRPKVKIAIFGPADVFALVRTKNKVYHPWDAFTSWPERLSQIDIGIAPLTGQYDRRRSWIKGIEYSLMGIPWIGTDFQQEPQPYSVFGPHHLVRNQAKYWEERLLHMVDYLEVHREAMKIEQEWAREQDIDRNVQKILDVYANGTQIVMPSFFAWTMDRVGAGLP